MSEEQDKESQSLSSASDASETFPSSTSEPDLDFIREFWQLQREQLSVRQEEINIQKQERDNAHEFAKLSLDAEVKDREQERNLKRGIGRDRLWFAAAMVVVLIVFIGLAMYWNKDQIALEILKAIIFLVTGALGGFSYARAQSNNDKSEK